MNTFIFDLDGTLLPMDQDIFVDTYFKTLAVKFSAHGLEADKLMKAIWMGTSAMIQNDGIVTNEERFWSTFCGILGDEIRKLEPEFENFYQNEFIKAKASTNPNPMARECIKLAKQKGFKVVLATNPIFPRVATLQRVKWAGLDKEDFELITTYENSSYCKPNTEYYNNILRTLKLTPQECIMVGNDVSDDMCVSKLGMDTFLLTDCLINVKGEDISNLKQGGFKELYQLIEQTSLQ